ncbi:MAG: alpha/beta hydrolase [Planctomycetota bacterium]
MAIFSLQAQLIYFPDREYWTTPESLGLGVEDLTLTTADGLSLAAWYLPHNEAKGTVLFCHGNAGNLANRVDSLKTLHHLGYNVLIFDYRGYGRSEGKPSEAGLYHDAEAAWRHLDVVRSEPPERIILFGESLGGAVAIDLAARHRPAALVVQSSFTSLIDIGKLQYPYLPVGLLCTHRYDSIKKVPNITCPKLFIHGAADELVPIENGRRLYEAAAEPKTFLLTPGGHNDGGFEYDLEYTRKLGDWLDRALRLTKPGQ